MIEAPSLREVLAWLREGPVAPPEDSEQRWRELIAAERPGPPVWLDALLFVGAWFLVGLLSCTCFPVWMLPGAAPAVGALAFIAATVGRWSLPGTIGRMAAPALFAIALSARTVLIFGLASIGLEGIALAAASVAVEGIALLVYPDRAHRTVTTLTLGIALLGLLEALDPTSAVNALIVGTSPADAAFASLTDRIRDLLLASWLVLGVAIVLTRPIYASTPVRHLLDPMSYGLAILGLAGLVRFWTGWADEGFIVWVGAGTGAVALVAVAVCLARVQASVGSWVVAMLGTAIVVALGLALPGLSASLAFVLLALLVRDVRLLVIAVIAVLSFGTWAYAVLDLPVLVKAGALFGSGAVLLGLRAWMRWRMSAVPA